MERRDFFKTAAAGTIGMFLADKFGLLHARPKSISTKAGMNVKYKDTFEKFNWVMSEIKKNKWQGLEIGDLTANVGKMFVGTPYVGGTLDPEGPEKCIVDLMGLDCVTLFENSLDIARIVKKGKFSFDDLINEVTFTRYRSGTLKDYASRLHYTADWFYDNEVKGVISDLSQKLGGKKFPYKVNYMTEKSKYYRALKENKSLIPAIKKYEEKINKRTYYYIPKDKIPSIEKRLKSGDIIAFATNKKGLDYAHTGLVYLDENYYPRLLHASSVDKVVKIDLPIVEYINKIESDIGISIARPLPVS
jgi:hypothetical protein